MESILKDKINQLHSRQVLIKNPWKSKTTTHSLVFPNSLHSFEVSQKNMTADEVQNIGGIANEEEI